MMRNYTKEEEELWNKYRNDKTLTEKERQKIIERLKKIEQKETSGMLFAH